MVICLEQGADLHMAQLMPLPLTVSCFSKIQIGFAFLVPADPGSPGQRAVKRVCVCVCAVLHTRNTITLVCARFRAHVRTAVSYCATLSPPIVESGTPRRNSLAGWCARRLLLLKERLMDAAAAARRHATPRPTVPPRRISA